MRFIEALELLEGSKEYEDFKKQYPKAYLAHAFRLKDKDAMSEWQLGYYIFKDDKMVTFFMLEPIKVSPESEVFKKPDTKIRRVDPDKVKVTMNQALETSDSLIKKKYKGQLPQKTVVILQDLAGIGQVWNITFVTMQMCTINCKISTETGKVLRDKMTSIFEFKKD